MGIFKTKEFHKWASKEGLVDAALRMAVEEIAQGRVDALGGDVYKKRVALPGRGKRGGARTLVAFKYGKNTFFMYGFAKNQRANIKADELKALKLLAKQLFGYSNQGLDRAVEAGVLIKVNDDGKKDGN